MGSSVVLRLITVGTLLLVLAPPVFATGQRGDILVLNGKEYSIFTNPLRPYLDENPGRLPKSNIISTSLWRAMSPSGKSKKMNYSWQT
jgi:hypothetical protein